MSLSKAFVGDALFPTPPVVNVTPVAVAEKTITDESVSVFKKDENEYRKTITWRCNQNHGSARCTLLAQVVIHPNGTDCDIFIKPESNRKKPTGIEQQLLIFM